MAPLLHLEGLVRLKKAASPGSTTPPLKTPRYYQLNAVRPRGRGHCRWANRRAAGHGHRHRQDLHRLPDHLAPVEERAPKNASCFLADRNILIDQTMVNDFQPLQGRHGQAQPQRQGRGAGGCAGHGVGRRRWTWPSTKPPSWWTKATRFTCSLYQAVTGTEEERNIYKQFSPDFFDLIVVDECHRGSAAEDSAWRDILTYFASATQIGLTATPKETEDVSNTDYFGEPVYTYSLKQGIEDGYLAPYKVIRVDLDKDTFGWRPTAGMTDKHGHAIEDRIYTGADMNRKLVLEQRDVAVAAKITEYLEGHRPLRQDHRLLRRHRPRRAHAPGAQPTPTPTCAPTEPKYVVQITGDNTEGKLELDNFIDPRKPTRSSPPPPSS